MEGKQEPNCSNEKFNSNIQLSYPEMLNILYHLVFNLTQDNLETSIEQTIKLFDSNDYTYSFNVITSKLIYFALCSHKNPIDLYLKYLQLIQTKEEEINENNKIIEIFSNYISKIYQQETYYLIEKMIELNLVDKSIIKNFKTKYFAHYMTSKEMDEIDKFLSMGYDLNCLGLDTPEITFYENYKELSKNDWELHKKYVKESINENEIAKIIRNDDVEKLQEISTQTNFDYNQNIPKSLYERCSFVNKYGVALIDYSAYFGSIKCFKYLLLNEAKLNNTLKYAIAGGNLEIIHLCQQTNPSFEGSYETAIEYHNNDVFRYIYENKIAEINNMEELGLKCIKYHNYDILSFLFNEGMKVNKDIILESARNGNIFLVKHFLQNNEIPSDILYYSSESGNIELVKYILEQKGIDINIENEICFRNLIFKGKF